jgi:hypothetical protein
MPRFPNQSDLPTAEQAISSIILSVAMEEIALSHIMEAESEKINFVVEAAKQGGNVSDLLAVNESVADVLESIVKLQTILKEKLDAAINFTPPAPTPECVPKFVMQACHVWQKNGALFLDGTCGSCSEPCNNGVKITRKNCETRILLPQGKKFQILLELDASNKTASTAKIHAEFRLGEEVVQTEVIAQDGEKIKIAHTILHETPLGGANTTLTFRLISSEKLSRVNGAVTIQEVA